MPRNRRPQAAEEKRAEILAVAERLFAEVGYEKTSMAQLAAAAGVTPTTIYWYFEDKDALLVGVLDQIVGDAVGQLGALAEMPLVERMLWVVERLERYHNLVTVVHSRTTASSRINEWHNNFHLLVETMLAQGLREAGFAEAEISARTTMGVFAVEGLLTHQLDGLDRRALIELVTRNPAKSNPSS